MRIVKPISILDANLISSSVPENDQQAYSTTTGYNLKDKVMVLSNHTIYEVKKQETSVVTISQASPAVVTWTGHGLANGRQVKFSTSATFPTPINGTTVYYVRNATENTFNISTTETGALLNTTSAGVGTQSALALITNIDPVTNSTYWLSLGKTNRWKMFDTTVQSQTAAVTQLTTQVYSGSVIDTVTLLNLSGNEVSLSVSVPSVGVVYSQTKPLVTDSSPVKDWWDYFFTDFKIRTDVVFEDIPPYANATYTITVKNVTGTTAAIGATLLGQSKDISSAKMGVEQGARVGITDYSIKTRDSFGNYVITERAFSKRANWTVYVDNTDIDDVQTLLASCRATPVLYIGSKKYASTVIYGFYKSFDVTIAYPDHSVLDIEIDGLT